MLQQATPGSTTCTPAAAGRRVRPTSPPAATSSGRTSRTTACCATTRRRRTSPCSARPRATRTGTRSTGSAGWCRASTATGGSPGPSTTGRSPCWPTPIEGRRLNSPNDVVVRSDGSVWFTDPAYGIDSDYEGHKSPMEQDECYLFRIDPAGGLSVAMDGMSRPNGLAFSLDERQLYVSDTGGPRQHPPVRRGRGRDAVRRRGVRQVHERRVRRLPAGHRGPDLVERRRRRPRLRPGRDAARQGPGAGGGGQRVLRRPKRNRLYICATTSLYAILLPVNGAKTF